MKDEEWNEYRKAYRKVMEIEDDMNRRTCIWFAVILVVGSLVCLVINL
jgi:hypothetical protein